MANWVLLTDYLQGITHDVTLSWTELELLVGGLPASALHHRAWWSGDRTHVRAWRTAGFEVTNLHRGDHVSFSRRASSDPLGSSAAARPSGAVIPASTQAAEANATAVGPDFLLLTCVRSKQSDPAPARDLYVSPLFRLQRAYAESAGIPWFILSAEHGLVSPDHWIAPYELYLRKTSQAYRAAWGSWVAAKLELRVGPLRSRTIEAHAGSTYVDAVRPHLRRLGATVTTPLSGLRLGERLAWYGQHNLGLPVVEPTEFGVEQLVEVLLDESLALSPQAFLATGGMDLKRPGLYSWWVDAPGAQELGHGLGSRIEPGLIYAGLAGATRWPSGKASKNTLWSRIGGMHLGSKHEFSTFRRTIGSILASTTGATTVDENALTAWMSEHLRVITVPHDDADTLGKMEKSVLELLDPPLNLQGMGLTPVRRELKKLRAAVN